MSAVSTSAHPKPPSTLTRWVTAHPLVTFFVLAMGITWGIVGGAMLAIGSGAVAGDAPVMVVLQELYSFGPALAALVVAAVTADLLGLRELLASLDPRRIRPGWYPVVIVTPVLALLLGEAVFYGLAPVVGLVEHWPMIFTRYLYPVLTTVLLSTGIAEELGWRGFAQPRLQARYGPLAGSVILGAAAALWHLPNAVLLSGGLRVFALQALYTIVVAVLFTYAYNRNHGSTLIVALFHAALNTSNRLVAPLIPIADQLVLTRHIYMVILAIVSLVAVVLIVVTRGRLGLAPGRDNPGTR